MEDFNAFKTWVNYEINFSESRKEWSYYGVDIYQTEDGKYDIDMEHMDSEYSDKCNNEEVSCTACNEILANSQIDTEMINNVIYPHYVKHKTLRARINNVDLEVQLTNGSAITLTLAGDIKEWHLPDIQSSKLHLMSRMQEGKPYGIEAVWNKFYDNLSFGHTYERDLMQEMIDE